jgi:hypothetical protein
MAFRSSFGDMPSSLLKTREKYEKRLNPALTPDSETFMPAPAARIASPNAAVGLPFPLPV